MLKNMPIYCLTNHVLVFMYSRGAPIEINESLVYLWFDFKKGNNLHKNWNLGFKVIYWFSIATLLIYLFNDFEACDTSSAETLSSPRS